MKKRPHPWGRQHPARNQMSQSLARIVGEACNTWASATDGKSKESSTEVASACDGCTGGGYRGADWVGLLPKSRKFASEEVPSVEDSGWVNKYRQSISGKIPQAMMTLSCTWHATNSSALTNA
jgi:hypothetical protein